jgi:hypothetical protein
VGIASIRFVLIVRLLHAFGPAAGLIVGAANPLGPGGCMDWIRVPPFAGIVQDTIQLSSDPDIHSAETFPSDCHRPAAM